MHLKRLNAPKNWDLKRKEHTFTARPLPGPHSVTKCITLNLVLRLMKYASTSKEIKTILLHKEVLVDKIRRKDYRFPLGVMDVFEIPELKERFRILYDKSGNFIFHKISEVDSKLKVCKIIGKKVIGKNKIQLNFIDGKNTLVEKDSYKVGDSIVMDLTKREIKSHLKLEKGAIVYIMDGKYVGEIGHVENIINNLSEESRIIIKSGEKKFETLTKYAVAVEKDFKI